MEDCRLRPWRRTTRRDASSPPLPQHPSPLDVLELNRRSGSCRRRRQVTLALYLLATGTHKVHRRGTAATPLWPSARNGPIIRLANQNPLPDLKMPSPPTLSLSQLIVSLSSNFIPTIACPFPFTVDILGFIC